MYELSATPQAEHLTIRYGTSPKINSFSWAGITCVLKNKDAVAGIIDIKLIDKLRGGYSQKTVFVDQIEIPPKTVIKYNTPVMIESSEEYYLDCSVNRTRRKNTSSALLSLASWKKRPLPIFNDSNEISLGSYRDIPDLSNYYYPSYFAANTTCRNWKFLALAPCIIMLRPDFSNFSSEKINAIMDYVKMGGKLLFADPIGLRDAMKTPLADLSPVIPLHTTTVSKIPEIKKIIPSYKKFTKPVPFLLTLPNGRGITLLKHRGYPLIRERKFGLGTVCAVMFPIEKNTFTTSNEWGKVLKSTISNMEFYNDTDLISPVLDDLNGFTVAGLANVQMILALYFILLVASIGAGLYFKKTALAWVLSGGISIAFAFAILYLSIAGVDADKGDFLSFVEVHAPTPTDNSIAGAGFYELMSTKDHEISFSADYENVLISALPPSETKIMMMASNNGMPPLEVKRVNGIPGINHLNLPVNSPRLFCGYFSKPSDVPEIKLPEVEIDDKGAVFKDWAIPSRYISVQTAWLQLPSGALPLTVQGGKLIQASSPAAFSSDTIIKKLREFMTHACQHSSPMIVLVENSSKPSFFTLKNVIPHGKKVTILPVAESFKGRRIVIPPAYISLSPGDPSTKLVMKGNYFKPSIYTRGDTSYTVKFNFPSFLANIKINKIKIEFEYQNDSKNVIVRPILKGKKTKVREKLVKHIRGRRKNKKNRNRTIITYEDVVRRKELFGKEEQKGVFVFNDINEVISPALTYGLLDLKVHLKDNNIPMGSQRIANTWSIRKLKITLYGELQKSERKILF